MTRASESPGSDFSALLRDAQLTNHRSHSLKGYENPRKYHLGRVRGWLVALEYLVAAVSLMVTIVGLPFGKGGQDRLAFVAPIR